MKLSTILGWTPFIILIVALVGIASSDSGSRINYLYFYYFAGFVVLIVYIIVKKNEDKKG